MLPHPREVAGDHMSLSFADFCAWAQRARVDLPPGVPAEHFQLPEATPF